MTYFSLGTMSPLQDVGSWLVQMEDIVHPSLATLFFSWIAGIPFCLPTSFVRLGGQPAAQAVLTADDMSPGWQKQRFPPRVKCAGLRVAQGCCCGPGCDATFVPGHRAFCSGHPHWAACWSHTCRGTFFLQSPTLDAFPLDTLPVPGFSWLPFLLF